MTASDTAVRDVRTRAFTVSTDGPEADGTLAWDHTTLVLVEVRCGDVHGTGWTYGAPATVAVVRDELAPIVRGRDALDTAGAHEALRRALRNAGRPGLAAGAVSAVDLALWDAKARLLGVSLVALLGGAPRDVPVYGSGGFTTYDDARTEKQARSWLDAGHTRVKIKIGEAWGRAEQRDLDRVHLVRNTVGEHTELYVDANGGYGRKQAVRVADAMADDDVVWFEEPVSSDDLAGLREVRDRVRPDVTAGEYAYDPYQFAALADVVDCLQADATRCGGYTGWLRAAAVAGAAGLEVSAHCAPNVHAHIGPAVPNLRHLEWFHDHLRVEERLFSGALQTVGGAVVPGASGAPGHGLTLKEGDAEPYRVA
ncbi:enolase C-terminal domain-like protein [Yinghuangia seranimata]|uniref:enolase C-terminal domain-like protein n=1 Tax=Yinghuangia seranimata TaxID=408067 RepID=UPI00248B7CA9|nr:enolase C-terminal domain-like protein [Yinghuangia seranimata]MDI2125368.1 enolase C-terminal domain-like protein [Yinghuangia seranimata]